MSIKQAENWAKRVTRVNGTGRPFVTEYEYDGSSELNVLVFDSPTEEWFDFVRRNRNGGWDHDYDVVIGPVADEGVYTTFVLFENNEISLEDAIRRLDSVRLDGQILFHSELSLKYVKYIGCWEVE